LFLFSGPSAVNFRVIPHVPTALGVRISSFRQRGAFVKGKVQDVRVSEESVEEVFSSQSEEICASCESRIAEVDYVCVEGVVIETGFEALSYSLIAVFQSFWYSSRKMPN
jgi:hypothetical protein